MKTGSGIFLLWLILPLNMLAQGKVTIHCTFDKTVVDSCTLVPSVYFIDEYEKSYKAPIVNNQCDFSFAISKPAIARVTYIHQTTEIFIQPNDELQMKIAGDSGKLSISFAGTAANQNEFLKSFYQTFGDDFDKKAVTATI